jgi:uncharacterized protein (TIGR02271 family)
MAFEKSSAMATENNSLNDQPDREDKNFSNEKTIVIPVVQEFLKADKKVVETGKIHIKKEVVAEDSIVNIPLTSESYKIERIPVKDKVFDEPPQVRHEGDEMIIPVIKEVVEIRTRYEVTEEIHLIKNKNVTPHSEKVTLKKEKVTVERERSEDK